MDRPGFLLIRLPAFLVGIPFLEQRCFLPEFLFQFIRIFGGLDHNRAQKNHQFHLLHRFVLLDAQDWMNENQLAALWTEIDRTADSRDARVIFRTAGADSPLPEKLPEGLLAPWLYHEWQSRVLHTQDRSSIYGGFHVYARRPLS